MGGQGMKRVVTGGDLKQDAMRPADLLDGYLERVGADIARLGLLLDGRARACPACGGEGTVEFTRMGFPYHRCASCQSLFVSPLPSPERLASYHVDGEAERFRREQVLPLTADVRTRHASAPRAHWVVGTATARLGARPVFALWGAHSSRFIELLNTSGSVVGGPGDGVMPPPGQTLDAVIVSEVLERAADFQGDLHRCRTALRPGGLVFVTTMSGDGFEVRMLGPRMRSLVPPVHLQLLSRAGWQAALSREGFTLVEYSTPGELDVQAVADSCRQNAALRLPPILDELVRHDDAQVGRAFQELLQQACLSSHVQLVAEVRQADESPL